MIHLRTPEEVEAIARGGAIIAGLLLAVAVGDGLAAVPPGARLSRRISSWRRGSVAACSASTATVSAGSSASKMRDAPTRVKPLANTESFARSVLCSAASADSASPCPHQAPANHTPASPGTGPPIGSRSTYLAVPKSAFNCGPRIRA